MNLPGRASSEGRRAAHPGQVADTCDTRAQALARHYAGIQALRMAGVPLLNPRLQVQAVGFEPWDEAGQAQAMSLGILVTPWFMNLVWLPLRAGGPVAGGVREVAGQRFQTTAVHEPGLGGFEVCSLFSPMFEFEDQAAAVATAQGVLALLRPVRPVLPAAAGVQPPAAAGAQPPAAAARIPARRRFLLGRSGVAA